MSSKTYSYILPLALAVLASPIAVQAQVVPNEPGTAGVEAVQAGNDGIQVLEQGPVHEAFAEPVVLEAGKGIVVDRAPPDAVNELPPDVKPEGNNVQWISGYWMWSDQQNDFIWVSGVWRDIPPGRRWVPGHWLKAAGGFEWVPGFWAAEAVQEVNLLPTPPDTLEVGPSSPAPGDNFFWVPGCWVWQQGNYVWRAGYWYAGQTNWVWVPDHYCYTSYGAYYVNGYWDYPLASRGLLYAPVYWNRPIYNRPGYFYRPYSVVNSALLLTALFVNPYHSHYYYGYGGWGNNSFYRPWWSSGWGGRVYDPFYSYHRWHDGRNHHDWHDHVRRDWDRHHDHDGHGDHDRGDWDRDGRGHGNQLVTNINDFRRQQGDGVRIRDLNQNEIQQAVKRSENWQRIREARTLAAADAAARVGSERLREGNIADDLGTSPRSGRSDGLGANLGGDASAQVGTTGPGGRRLRIDGAAGTPRATFRLPPTERSDSEQSGVQVGGGLANQADAAARLRGSVNNRENASGFNANDVNREAINRRFNLPNTGSGNVGRNAGSTLPGRGNAGRVATPPQNNNLTIPGGGRPATGDTSQLGRGFRYNAGQGQQNLRVPTDGVQQRSFRGPSGGGNPNYQVPSGGGSSIRIPSGNSGGSSRIHVPSGISGNVGGSSSIRLPSGAGRSFSAPSGGGGSPAIRIPSGGSSVRGFSGGGGGGQSNFRSGGGGGGGQSMMRGGGGGGGGGQQMRSGGGGGGRQFQGGGGNRGGGRGRGRD